MSKKPSKPPTLEESLTEITQLIDTMEHGEQTLEQSLSHFERGITLVKHCQHVLEKAEQKVHTLIQQNNKDTLVPYDDDELDTEESDHED